MKKYLFLLPVLVCTLMVTGCEKKLEIIPTFQTTEEYALSTVDGMDAALSSAYQFFHSPVGRSSVLWAEAMGDHLVYKGSLQNYINYYQRNMVAIIEEESAPGSGRYVSSTNIGNQYRAVNASSLVIRAIERGYADADLAFAANKNRLLGESYFIRAATYFDILRFYSKPWGATADNSQPGIVINYDAVEDRESQVRARATVAEVYAFIIADLVKAEELLPVAYDAAVHPIMYSGRTYKDGARAYLARVYFQQQNYAKAKEVINRLLGSTPGVYTNHPLETADITSLFKTRGPNDVKPENILQTTASVTVNALTTFWNSSPDFYSLVPGTSSQARASVSFLQDAKFDVADMRYTKLLRPGVDGMIPSKYSQVAHFNEPLIRTAEMILDRAEANVLADNLGDAITDINAIRSRAGISTLPGSIAKAPLLDSIRIERIRELCFEGDRLWNLKRLKLPIPPGERTGAALPWDGNELLLKYSSKEMSKNNLLVNNY